MGNTLFLFSWKILRKWWSSHQFSVAQEYYLNFRGTFRLMLQLYQNLSVPSLQTAGTVNSQNMPFLVMSSPIM